jgi:hypothetical protein
LDVSKWRRLDWAVCGKVAEKVEGREFVVKVRGLVMVMAGELGVCVSETAGDWAAA